MGYSKLSYDDIIENPEVWRDEESIISPSWAEEISELGYKGVWAVDFYMYLEVIWRHHACLKTIKQANMERLP